MLLIHLLLHFSSSSFYVLFCSFRYYLVCFLDAFSHRNVRVNNEVEREGRKKHVKSLESVARLILFLCLFVYSFIYLSDFVRFGVM